MSCSWQTDWYVDFLAAGSSAAGRGQMFEAKAEAEAKA